VSTGTSAASGGQSSINRAYPLQGLMGYIGGGEWRDAFLDLAEEHLKPVLDLLGLDTETLGQLLGPQRAGMLWGCILEDFLASCPEPEFPGLMEGYLATSAEAGRAASRAFMLAVRQSSLGLYEIMEVSSTGSLAIRDLLRNNQTISLAGDRRTEELRPGDGMAARVIVHDRAHVLSASLLPLSAEAIHRLVQQVSLGTGPSRADLPNDPHSVRHMSAFIEAWVLENLPNSFWARCLRVLD